ncbi:MAG: trypsin-like peptidase domain-containing protein [Dehalococcoidales bacterium]
MSLLALIIILIGGMGTYSYLLNQRLDVLNEELNEKLRISQEEQAIGIGDVADKLEVFKDEALDGINRLAADLAENRAENAAEIIYLEETIDDNLDTIYSVRLALQGDINDLSGELSKSLLDAGDLYEEVVGAVVRITDGERVIGTGFLIDNAGHVMTAHHVIESLTDIEVVLTDGSIYSADVTGSSRISDIAVLTLDRIPDVTPLEFADSAGVTIGQPVVAIGNPFEISETLTAGIVSQLNRFIEIGGNSQAQWVANLIQFDAAVNFGNSGCPLFNSRREVIGMVVARIGPELGDGINYAVSSNKLNRVSKELISDGTFDYPWLGVVPLDLTPKAALDLGLASINGVLIGEVVPGSPAETGGIEVDDIIISMDGQEIRTVEELSSFLGEFASPDQAVSVVLLRDGASLELTVVIGSRSS